MLSVTSRAALPIPSYHELERASRGATKVVAVEGQLAALRCARPVALRKGEGRSVKVIRQKSASTGKTCSGVSVPAHNGVVC